MKKIYLLLMLFCFGNIHVSGQAMYKMKYTVDAWGAEASCDGTDEGHAVSALFTFQSGTSLTYWRPEDGSIINDTSKTVIFSINENSKNFYVTAKNIHDQYRSNGTFKCGCCVGYNLDQNRQWKTDLLNIYKTTSYATFSYGIPDWSGAFRVTFYPSNLAILDEPQNVLLENDPLNINATSGFPSDAYTWIYTVPGDPRFETTVPGFPPTIKLPVYKELLSFKGSNSGTITGSELLGDLFEEIASAKRTVIIYLQAKNEFGIMSTYSTKTLYPKLYAPKIISAVTQLAKCSDSKTSSVLISLDKPIGAGRSMKVGNYINGTGSSWYISDTDLNSSFQYELKDLAVNTSYEFKLLDYYQGINSLGATYYVNPASFAYTLNLFPPKIETKLLSNGVYCYGGKDGTMYGQVRGGTSPFTLSYTTKLAGTPLSVSHPVSSGNVSQWTSDGTVITSLQPGIYKLTTSDKNGCMIADSVTMIQPAQPLAITERINTEVTGYGLSNGSYQVKLKGGTIIYPVPVLKSTSGASYTAVLTGSSGNEYTYRFTNLPAGTFAFRAIDNALVVNAASIKDSAGCLVKESVTMIQPPPLVLSIEQTQGIKCFGDKAAFLTAHGTGGRTFTSGNPYNYQWSYSENGITAYTPLVNQDSVFTLRPAGFYKVLLSDKNNNQITKIFQVTSPLKIDADVSIKNVTCSNRADGSISLSNMRGGIAPLVLTWANTSVVTPARTDLAAGVYPFTISDASGCSITRQPAVKDTLNGIAITQSTSVIPTCYREATGSLSTNIVVGSPPYSILWNTGATTPALNNIAAGIYTITVTNSKNCTKVASFTLANPPSIAMDLETDPYLCKGQSAVYNLAKPGCAFVWTGPGFNSTSGNVRLTDEGTYTVSVQDTKGCKASNTITLHRVNAIVQADFVMPSQVFAGAEVSIVNITMPSMQDTAYWAFDSTNIDVIRKDDAYATLVFKEEGVYKITLHTKQGNCTEQLEKEVIVKNASFAPQTYTGATSFIKTFEIRPNPSDGNFEVMIKLQDIASVKLTLVDIYSKGELATAKQSDEKEYLIPMHVQIAAGTYMLFLETAYGVRVIKVIII